jgi:REP element-mobilizing transposase RayT
MKIIIRFFFSYVKIYLWGDKFWSSGYFCRSIGAVTTEAVEYYIKHSQEKHWKTADYEVYQQKLFHSP